MYKDILRGMKIIVTILRAAPAVTVARTTIITAWDIFRSIAMVMAVPILTSIGMKTTMIAAVAMTMVLMRLMNTMSTMSTRMMSVAVDTSMSTMSTRMMNAAVVMSMKSMSTMNVAVVTSITIMSIMCPVTLRTVSVSFAILTKSIVMFVAKA